MHVQPRMTHAMDSYSHVTKGTGTDWSLDVGTFWTKGDRFWPRRKIHGKSCFNGLMTGWGHRAWPLKRFWIRRRSMLKRLTLYLNAMAGLYTMQEGRMDITVRRSMLLGPNDPTWDGCSKVLGIWLSRGWEKNHRFTMWLYLGRF